jgi:hypothetical protein
MAHFAASFCPTCDNLTRPQVPAPPFRKKTEFFILISGNSCYIHWYGPFTGNKRLREGESENG